MDTRLKQALEFANYRQTLSAQRKLLNEKSQAKLTYGYAGGLFKIDQTLINFIVTLESAGRVNNVIILDSNENPILIENLEDFKDEVFDRYFTVTNEYYEEYKKIKTSRSVEKLISYE